MLIYTVLAAKLGGFATKTKDLFVDNLTLFAEVVELADTQS